MIHKIKSSLLAITLSFFALMSCSEDFLENTPTDSIASSDALSSAENMTLVLNGLHRQMYAQSPLPDATGSRSGQSFYLVAFDAIAGNIIHSARGNGWMRSEVQWRSHNNASFNTVRNLWYQRYHFIASTNAIINTVNDGDFVIDDNMNNILGQSHAYRAWSYHQLITTYAKGYLIGNPSTDPGVPLMFSTEAPFTSLPRSTVAEIYAQIEKDIDLAISYLENASSPDNKSHISINAAYGIKARIALSKGDWGTAATAAVQARDGFTLIDEATWKTGFNTYDLSEVIWGGRVIDTETNFFQSYFYFMCNTFNGSQTRGNPKLFNEEIWNNIPVTDYRKDVVLSLAPNTNSAASNGEGGSFESDPNYSDEASFNAAYDDIIDTYGTTTGHNTHPFMSFKFKQKNPGTIDPDDVNYMRASEMYLIEAEAQAMLNNISGAQDALAVLGVKRDPAFDKTDFATQESLMDQIKFQRRVELFGEGFSFHDQIRWDEGIDHTNSGASEVLYGAGFKQDKPSINDGWIWKIPQAEIDANDSLTEADQN